MKTLLITLAGLAIAACGGPSEEAPADAPETEDTRGGVIGEGYVDSLDKAEAVEDLAIERKAAIDEAADPPD